MRGQEWPAAVERFAAVSLEGVGEVVQRNVEQPPKEEVGHAVDDQLVLGVVDHAAAANEPGTENRIPTFAQETPVADHVPAVVGFIGHHDHDGIPAAGVDAESDRSAKAVLSGIPHGTQSGDAPAEILEGLPGGIRAAVVHRDDFVWNVVQAQFDVQMLDGGGNGGLFVPAGDDYGKQLQRLVRRGVGGLLHRPLLSSQSGCNSAYAAISSRICSMGWSTSHPKSPSAAALSITIHGTS